MHYLCGGFTFAPPLVLRVLVKIKTMKASIVIVDDESSTRTYLSHFLGVTGYAVESLADGDQLLASLSAGLIPSLILLDVVLPGRDGIEVIQKINEAKLNIPVIMLSGIDQTKTVVEAMKMGAFDFLLKPVDEVILAEVVRSALEKRVVNSSSDFVTKNPRMLRVAQIIKRVAGTDLPILILGESGVGKEVMARYAHSHSGRANKPFVKVNCAALPHELLESELFGHERGAFTGAVTDREGKFEQAHTGTLLLDEIGEMSPHLQSKLLHVLQDGTFTRLGARKETRVDARIIASTNIKIEKAIAQGKFRQDLYFRLNVISVELPPLRERREDIPALCDYFITNYRERYNSEIEGLSAELLNRFVQHDWPGNIRELENFVKRFLVLPDHHSLLADLSSGERTAVQDSVQATDSSQSFSLLNVGAGAADRAERELVRRVMEETHGNRKEAARRMNICYKALLNKLKRWAGTSAPQIDPEGTTVKGKVSAR
jgi:two-component system response regulator AtoC